MIVSWFNQELKHIREFLTFLNDLCNPSDLSLKEYYKEYKKS